MCSKYAYHKKNMDVDDFISSVEIIYNANVWDKRIFNLMKRRFHLRLLTISDI